MYDPASDRARLIDFELVHRPHIPAVERQADDLLVFLLDIITYAPQRRWLALRGPLSRLTAANRSSPGCDAACVPHAAWLNCGGRCERISHVRALSIAGSK